MRIKALFLLLGMLLITVSLGHQKAGSKKLVIKFGYQGAGSDDDPIPYLLLRHLSENRTVSNALLNALHSYNADLKRTGTPITFMTPLPKTYVTGTRLLTLSEVSGYNKAHPRAVLPPRRLFGVAYEVSYRVEPEAIHIDIAAILQRRGAGVESTYQKVDGYDPAYFVQPLASLVEQIFASGIYDRGDVASPVALVRALIKSNSAVTKYIWTKAGDAQIPLKDAAAKAHFDVSTMSSLIYLLNRVLYDPAFPEVVQRSKIILPSAPSALLANYIQMSTSGVDAPEGLPYLNRQLLVAIFPNFINRNALFEKLYRIPGVRQ